MTAIVAIVVAIGIVWAAVGLLRAPLLPAAFGVLLVGVCLGYDFLHFKTGPATMTLDRLALPWLLALYLVQRRFGRTDPKPIGASEWLLGGLLCLLVFSTLTHDYRTTFYKTATPFWRLGTAYFIPAIFYWIARQAVIDERQLQRVHAVLVALGVYLALTGVCEVAQQWAFVFPKHIADPKLGIHFGRARGPMLSSVTYGLFLGTCFLGACLYRSELRILHRKGTWLLLPVFAAGLYCSLTRSIWMGVALGIMIIFALMLQGMTRNVVIGFMLFTGLVGAALKSDSLMSFKRDRGLDAGEAKDSAEMRLSFAYVSWQMFLDRPLFGWGFGQFPRAKLPYLSDRSVDLPLEPIRPLVHHNTFLSLVSETGGIGLALFLGLLASWGRTAWLVCRSPVAPDWAKRHCVFFAATLGLYACQLLFHELSYSVLDNCLIFLLAGITAGLRPLAFRKTDSTSLQPGHAAQATGRLVEFPASLTPQIATFSA